MKIKYMIFILLIALLFAFPQKARAEEISLWVLSYEEDEELIWNEYKVYYESDLNKGIEEVFRRLFENHYEGYGYPKETALLYANLHEGHLILNVSKEIKSYGGGGFYETVVVAQILKTALDIPQVNKVTLLIEAMTEPLPEGTIIEGVMEWKDWI